MSEFDQIHDATEALLDAAQEIGWTIEHYEIEVDPYETPELRLRLKDEQPAGEVDVIETNQSKEQRDRIGTIKEIIRARESKDEKGAEVAAVINEATNGGEVDKETVKDELQKLKSQGEIYEPTTEHLRTT